MKRFWIGVAAMFAVSACSGGNPFTEETDTDTSSIIPEVIAGAVEGITYDPVAQTLVVRGVALDDTPFESVYRRRPSLDRGGYEAYTAQDSSLDQHSTAYVRDINGTRAAVVATGGQFEHYFGGVIYGREGGFDPVDVSATNGQVSYAGNYVGLLNLPGDGGDLLPVAPGTPAEVRPRQAGEVTGRVLVNADFADNVVQGGVFQRVYVDSPGTNLEDLAFEPADIDPTTGSFTNNVTINLQTRGTYGGIFGGPNAEAVAGGLFVQDHIEGIDNEEEYGIFVLNQCGTPGEDPLCNQPVP
ncbi:MAG: thymidylate synthase [Arenibacterium sp.]